LSICECIIPAPGEIEKNVEQGSGDEKDEKRTDAIELNCGLREHHPGPPVKLRENKQAGGSVMYGTVNNLIFCQQKSYHNRPL
jgi:hypothetical protein